MSERWEPPYRGGYVHVLADRCSTCVFRPGNLMNLSPGRLKGMVQDSREADSAVTCHQTLEHGTGPKGTPGAICRGFFDAHKTTPLILAEAMGLIVEDPVPKKDHA